MSFKIVTILPHYNEIYFKEKDLHYQSVKENNNVYEKILREYTKMVKLLNISYD